MPQNGEYVLGLLTGSCEDLCELSKDESRLPTFIDQNIAGKFHIAPTCRMGRSDDPHAVVEADARVHGLARLRIIDASIMPVLVRGNINIPTITMAEKLADVIKRDC